MARSKKNSYGRFQSLQYCSINIIRYFFSSSLCQIIDESHAYFYLRHLQLTVQIVAVNDTFRKITGIGIAIESMTTLDVINLFDYNSDAFRMVTWSRLNPSEEPLVVGAFLRVYKNCDSLRTQQRHGQVRKRFAKKEEASSFCAWWQGSERFRNTSKGR